MREVRGTWKVYKHVKKKKKTVFLKKKYFTR